MSSQQREFLSCWSVNRIAIGDSYSKVVQEKGAATTKLDIQGRPVVRYYYEGDKLILSVFFSADFLWKKPSDKGSYKNDEITVSHVKGLELTGPGGVSLSEHDSIQKVVDTLGDPDKVSGPHVKKDYFWTYFKSDFSIEIYVDEEEVRTIHLKMAKS